MTPKEKAEELLNKFIPHGYPFSAGSGYMTGDIDKDGQKRHAKELAKMCVDEVQGNIQDAINLLVPQDSEIAQKNLKDDYLHWSTVREIIGTL